MRELGSRQVMQQRVRRKARVGWKRIAGRWMMDKANGVDSADLFDYGSELPAFRQRTIEATGKLSPATIHNRTISLCCYCKPQAQPLSAHADQTSNGIHCATAKHHHCTRFA